MFHLCLKQQELNGNIVDVFGVLPALLAAGIERFYPLKVVGWTLLSILAIWAATLFTLRTCRVFSVVSFGLREHVLRCGPHVRREVHRTSTGV